ncbi:MAG: AAA family ATPase [Bacilli bacterium]|nr:AAA family ATPase [Bacilli bacterium]
MLERIRFKNFKSFKNETLIDLTPSRIEYLSDTNVYDGTLKGVAFYGSNASGKTNALYAVTLLLDLLFKNGPIISADTFSLFSKEKKMWFEYSFRFDEDRVVYSFEADREKGFTSEKLIANNEPLLERTLTSAKSHITENQDYDGIDQFSLFIRSIYFNTRFAGQPLLAKWFSFLKNSIFFNPIRTFNQLIPFDAEASKDISLLSCLNKHGTKEINDFLEEYNFPFRIEYETPNALTPGLPVPWQLKLKAVRKGMAPVPFYLESMGSQMLLSFLPAFLKVVKDGGILAIDEFSSGFHNDLEELLVSYFYKHAKRAQLIFVSHSTNLLKTALLRPDQVYSVDFDTEGSKIAKFSEYGMRESQNMEKMYLAGAFGGIPLYDVAGK